MDIFNLTFDENPVIYNLTIQSFHSDIEIAQPDPIRYTLHIASTEDELTFVVSNPSDAFVLNVTPTTNTCTVVVGSTATQQFQLQVSEAIFASPVDIRGRTINYDGSNRVNEVLSYLDASKIQLHGRLTVNRVGNTINTLVYYNNIGDIIRTRTLEYDTAGRLIGEMS